MANYHVNYLTGSDVTGDGSTGNPWATIDHALATSVATTGDVIKVVGSTTTTLDTAATVSTNDRTQTLTTSVDLSSSLTAGDIIIISPNITGASEYDGWMHTEVQSVTSTTLTTRAYHQFPNQTTLNFTITKVNDLVQKSTTETINNPQNYAGAIVECGYDATFTSVIGYTYWNNNSVGPGGRSGNCFYINPSGSIGQWDSGMPLMKNIAFTRWERGIRMSTFKQAYTQNVILYGCNANADTGGYYGPGTDATTDIYLSDCDGSLLDKNYYQYAAWNNSDAAPKNGAPLNVRVAANGERRMERTGGNIKGGLVGYSANSWFFGLNTLFNYTYNLNINCPVSLILNKPSVLTSTYRLSTVMMGFGQFMPTTLKLVRNGLTELETPWYPIHNSTDAGLAGSSIVKLPTGSSVRDYNFVGMAIENNFNASQTFIGDDGTWVANAGGFVQQNTVDQETGNSCLHVMATPAGSDTYAAKTSTPYLAQFPAQNAGLTLSAVQIRYKNINPAWTDNVWNLKTSIAGFYDSTTATNSFSSTSWSTWTANFTNNYQAKNYIQSAGPDTFIQLFLAKVSPTQLDGGSEFLIDSITPIYS